MSTIYEPAQGDRGDILPSAIVHFNAGDGGDVLDLTHALVSLDWSRTDNPFASGYLRVVQVGPDVIVGTDYDGVGGDDTVTEVFRLVGVNADSLTAFNFLGFDPGRAPAVATSRTGGAGDDAFMGGAGPDTLAGAAGADQLFGSFGDDSLAGGLGNDTLVGGFGNDKVDGGAGDDLLRDLDGGADQLVGGDGNDRIEIADASVWDSNFPVTIDAGAGADSVDLAAYFATLGVALGDGDDRVTIRAFPVGGITLSLGAGVDTVVLDPGLVLQAVTSTVISDFQAGAGGDRIDLLAYAGAYALGTGDAASIGDDFNPFATGLMRLVQVGNDAQLQLKGWPDAPLLVLKGVQAASLTDENFGVDIHPAAAPGAEPDTQTGTAAADSLTGGMGRDVISGLAGDDTLHGADGNDWLKGGEGRDLIDGGDGDDLIEDDGGGVLIGGTGNDTVSVVVTGYATGGSIDAGPGDDHVRVNTLTADLPVTLGSGHDTLELPAGFANNNGGLLKVADFQPADNGDVLDVRGLADGSLPYFWSLFPGQDPFAAGYFALRQVGADVELWISRQATPMDSGHAVVRFLNTTVDQFTAANFGGWDPHAVPNGPRVITSDLTIAAGVTDAVLNTTPAEDLTRPHFIYSSESAQFVNHGWIETVMTAPGDALTGIVVTGAGPDSTFVNAVDGRFVVDDRMDEPNPFTSAYGLWANEATLTIRNDGYFEVKSAGGGAEGIVTGYDLHATHPFINNGIFRVSSPEEAWGVKLGFSGAVENNGDVTVSGGTFAVGVYSDQYHAQSIVNTGTLTVTSDGLSVGVLLPEIEAPYAGSYQHTNSGTITADYAYYVYEVNPTVAPQGYVDVLNNSGTIKGAVVLGRGDDVIVNTGTMSGRSFLGDGNDTYDGASGFHSGSVEGEAGNDTLTGGAGPEALFGDSGDDSIAGGGGDDCIDGGSGNDTLTGGAGSDRFVFHLWTGRDVVEDFTAADTLEVHGYAGYQALVQDGADVEIVLSARDSIRVVGANAAQVAAALSFDPAPHGEGAGLEPLHAENDAVIDAGIAFDFGDTRPQLSFDLLPPSTAAYLDEVTLWNGGSLSIMTTQDGLTRAVAATPETFYGEQRLVNLGTIAATAAAGDVSGVDGISRIWNSGTLTVLAAAGDAIGIAGARSDGAIVVNSGTIHVSACGAAAGLMQEAVSSQGVSHYANSGVVDVEGTRASVGFDLQYSNFDPQLVSTFVNSGAVRVADATPVLDSVGVHLNLASRASMWNSGEVAADFAVLVSPAEFGGDVASEPYGLSLYNSGLLDGLVLLSTWNDVVVNTGAITGRLFLGGGGDLFDGRGGTSAVGADGWDGDDTLLGGVGADTLDGGFGNDVLDGGAGNDVLSGGAGRDSFRFTPGSGRDIVSDFEAGANGDYIDVSGYSKYQSMLQSGSDVLITFSSGDSLLLQGVSVNAIASGAIRFNAGAIAATVVPAAPGSVAAPPAPDGSTLPDAPIIGTEGDDTIAGGDRSERIEGRGGNDFIDGGAGNDTLLGGDGNDTLAGGEGNDSLDGGAGIDTVSYAGAGPVEVDLAAGTGAYGDTFTQIENIAGSSWNDQLKADAGDNRIDGMGGDDRIDGGDGRDILAGGAGNDWIIGGAGNDAIDGGADQDTAQFSGTFAQYTWAYNTQAGTFTFTDSQAGRDGTDVVSNVEHFFFEDGYKSVADLLAQGTAGNDSMTGSAGADVFNGLAGNDKLLGLAGDDTLDGGAGNDTLDGGADSDTASYADATAAVKVSLAVTKAQSTGGAGSDTLLNIENLLGSNYNDTLTGNTLANRIDGGNGNDTLDGGAGSDTLAGGSGNDSYIVDNAADTVVEGAGAGIDTVTAAVTFTLGAEVENLVLGGRNAISGTGNELANMITGNAAANTLYGLDGNDTLNGGAGADRMIGGEGDDTYMVDNATDTVIEIAGGGVDTIQSTVKSYTLPPEVENLVLAVGSKAAGGTGNDLDNIITGNAVTNTLVGGAGNDVLDGRDGADVLTGGAGNDTFGFSTAPNSRAIDKIMDFNAAQDCIALDNAVFKALGEGELPPSAFQAGATSVAASAAVHIIFNTTNGALLYDADGAGGTSAVQFATLVLTGLQGPVTAGDFMVI
jgi:Ca2+-binding RTX toxin-like protein